jgi:DNA-binding NtrC family response regulator
MTDILVIDDEPEICDFLEMALTAKNYNVVIANDGLQAMRLYRNRKFDVVITDIVMPHKDGIDVIFDLVEIDKGISIIVIYGSKGNFNLLSNDDLGVKSILKKPFTEIQLYDSVDKALGHEVL